MATQKPISTISYNTEPFLREKLEELLFGHIIQAYQYICHKGEDGDKDHIHLRIEPNKRIDPMDIQAFLEEYEKGKEKPLRCRPFRSSKEEDWFLYAVHDTDYLKAKYKGGEKGEKLKYDWHDIKVPDNYDLETAWIRARQSMRYSQAGIVGAIKKGESAESLITDGANPFQFNAILKALSVNDYQRLQAQYNDLQGELKKIRDAIEDSNFDLEIDLEGKYRLVKR